MQSAAAVENAVARLYSDVRFDIDGSQTAAVAVERGDAHLPALVARSEADQRDALAALVATRIGEPLGRRRMADGKAHVLAEDMLTEQRARRYIGLDHAIAGEHQHRFGNRLDHRGCDGERRIGSLGGTLGFDPGPGKQRDRGGQRDDTAGQHPRRDAPAPKPSRQRGDDDEGRDSKGNP